MRQDEIDRMVAELEELEERFDYENFLSWLQMLETRAFLRRIEFQRELEKEQIANGMYDTSYQLDQAIGRCQGLDKILDTIYETRETFREKKESANED